GTSSMLTRKFLLAHPLPEVPERSALASRQAKGLILKQRRQAQQEALELMPLATTALDESSHRGAVKEREVATKQDSVKTGDGSLDLVGMLCDELVHSVITTQPR